jgi:DNA repair protein RadC
MMDESLATGARERALEEGIVALGDAELVALVLGTGRVGESVGVLSAALLDELGGVAGLARAGIGELSARPGVGRAKGARIAAAVELGRRVAIDSARHARALFPEPRAVEAWARPRFAALDHEELWILALDGRNALRAARRVAMGGLHGMHVTAAEPLRAALREGASTFLLVHNHPSGDATPSTDDVEFTRRVARAAEAASTPLVDHVVVASGGYASFVELGLFGAG